MKVIKLQDRSSINMLGIAIFISLILLVPVQVYAKNDSSVLTIDRVIPADTELKFDHESDIEPDKSDFRIRNYLLMSNKAGERWATITLENASTGQRILHKNDLVGVFADGDRRYPVSVKQKFSGGEIITLTISFGISKFPLLYVLTKN